MTATLDTDVLLQRYRRYRATALEVQEALQLRIRRAMLLDAAERLGMFVDEGVLFQNEAEAAIFEDFLLMGYQRHGRTVSQDALTKVWPPVGSDHRAVLVAMAQSRYGIVRVTGLREGVGIHARELIADEDLFIVDVSMSRTAKPGTVVAGRLLCFPEMWAWSGASVPIPDENQLVEKLLKIADDLREALGRLSPADELVFAETLTALFVRSGLTADMEYRTSASA